MSEAAQADAGNRMRAEFDKTIARSVQALPALSSTLEETSIDIKVGDGWTSKCKVVRPKSATSDGKPHPLIVYYFGGGFVVGNPDMVIQPARDFAEKYDAVVVLPDYRKHPEVRWPLPQRDGWDVLVHLSSHASELGADLSAGFIVGGVSAGASIAGVCLGIAVYGPGDADKHPELKGVGKLAKPLTGVFLACGFFMTDKILGETATRYHSLFTSRKDTPSEQSFTAAHIETIMDRLGVDGDNSDKQLSSWFTPVMAMEKGETEGGLNEFELPKIFFHVGQHDPLRDDSNLTEQLYADASFETRIQIFPDDGHVAYTVVDMPIISKDPTPKEATITGMGWLLGKVTIGERQRGNQEKGGLLSFVTGKLTGQ